jgi:dihydroorotase
MRAAAAGGVTTLVCPPDTDPVLDESGLVDMLGHRVGQLNLGRVLPLGALTRGLEGEVLTEMAALTAAGCVGFSQSEHAMARADVMLRAFQYAATYGYALWLRPVHGQLDKGVAASGPLATRLGLSGVPASAETIALFTILEFMRMTGARVHLCRISSAAGVAMVRQAKAEGLALTADISINQLHLSENDMGYFDARARLTPPLRSARDRDALQQALLDGTVDAVVSDHTPVEPDGKAMPFAQAEPGATGLEFLLSAALKWKGLDLDSMAFALSSVTSRPAQVLATATKSNLPHGLGQLKLGGVADVCVIDPQLEWSFEGNGLFSQCKHTPFDRRLSGMRLPVQVKATWFGGAQVHGL